MAPCPGQLWETTCADGMENFKGRQMLHFFPEESRNDGTSCWFFFFLNIVQTNGPESTFCGGFDRQTLCLLRFKDAPDGPLHFNLVNQHIRWNWELLSIGWLRRALLSLYPCCLPKVDLICAPFIRLRKARTHSWIEKKMVAVWICSYCLSLDWLLTTGTLTSVVFRSAPIKTLIFQLGSSSI